jgi:hypothetical protein
MTAFAVRVALVHCEPNVIVFEVPVTAYVQFSACCAGFIFVGSDAGREEGISTFCAEEVLFMIGPFTEGWVV